MSREDPGATYNPKGKGPVSCPLAPRGHCDHNTCLPKALNGAWLWTTLSLNVMVTLPPQNSF